MIRLTGVVAVLCGFAAVVVGDRFAWFPSSRAVVVLVGLVSLFVGVSYVADRRLCEADRAPAPDRERGYRVSVPGDELDRAVERRESMRTIEQRLADRVRISLVEGDATREEAEAAVDRGTWTADPVAAAFLASEELSVPLTTRLRWALRGDSSFERKVSRTVSALSELREGTARE